MKKQLFLFFISVCLARPLYSQKDCDEYYKDKLYYTHYQDAYRITKWLTTGKLDSVKNLFPKGDDWKIRNKELLENLDNSPNYFPKCEPLDTSINCIYPTTTEDFITEIRFRYLCEKGKKGAENQYYIIRFLYNWKNHETTFYKIELYEEKRKPILPPPSPR